MVVWCCCAIGLQFEGRSVFLVRIWMASLGLQFEGVKRIERDRGTDEVDFVEWLKAGGLRLSLKASPLSGFAKGSQSAKQQQKYCVVRIVAEAQKTETLSPTSLLGEEGKSDVDSHASKASDRKLSIGDVPKDEFKGKTVFIRADLNVPLNDKQEIGDDTRIRASVPTIEYLLATGARVVLASHLGRPKKGPEAKFSLKPVGGQSSYLLHAAFLTHRTSFFESNAIPEWAEPI